jgi:poly-beta-1,6-N-acetyl-D-glucosamine synthase
MWLAVVIILLLFISYFLMVGTFTIGIYRLRKQDEPNSSHTSLSIVIAIRNEEKNIESLVKSISDQEYPANEFEVILVNDHSTDRTVEVLTNLTNGFSNFKIISLPDGQQGKKLAIALGLQIATFDTIVFTDADCKHHKGWLYAIASHFKNRQMDLLIGPVMIKPSKSFFDKFQCLEHSSLTASSIGACSVGLPFMASSANLIFSKSRLGFGIEMLNPDYPSGDDVFLLHSAKQKPDVRIGCLNNTYGMVYTKPVGSVTEFLHQRARWASKSSGYDDIAAILVASVVLFFNLSLILLLGLSCWLPYARVLLIIGFGLKSIADLSLLYLYLKKFGNLSILKVFLPLQLVYPFYIVVAFFLSIFGKTKWKERVGS